MVDSQSSGWGGHYVILPNPMYGSWYGALLDYKRGFSPAEEDSLRKAKLKNFER
jgi:predicted secreted acid phosphatase